MAWRAITLEQFKGRFVPQEVSALQQVETSGLGGEVDTDMAARLTDAIRVFVGAMTAYGYPVKTDDTLPDQLRNYAMSVAVWEYLKDFPKFDYMQTEARRKAYEEAQEALSKIARGEYGAIESPTGTAATGNWNSENKIVMRTHPVPTPASQYPVGTTAYANPNAPQDGA